MSRARNLADLLDSSGKVANADLDSSLQSTISTAIQPAGGTIDEVDLSAISATISDTAVDVFVYDTSKDSDGGAWRKRCQHTSWYNETLNTSTRGSRKEFPAVAVIVAEAQQVTIYDGDDPSMPMWMVFDNNARDMLGGAHSGGGSWISSVTALNCDLVVGSSSGYAPYLFAINLVNEKGRMWHYDDGRYCYNGDISSRNNGLGMYVQDASAKILPYCNDCAMTVLPNAPIDSATNLPIPTIAVATNGGVSVIKDDGSVVSNTGYGSSNTCVKLTFNELGDIIGAWGSAHSDNAQVLISTPPYTTSNNRQYDSGSIPTAYSISASYNDIYDLVSLKKTMMAFGGEADTAGGNTPRGLRLLDENPTTPSEGSVAYITSTYNTGWMNGDIKLAALSDTDDTDVVGSELVTNGDFSGSDLSSFVPFSSGTLGATVAIVGGELKLTNTGTANYAFARINIPATVGQKFIVSCDLRNGNADYAHLTPHSGCTFSPSNNTNGSTSYESTTHTVTATSTSVQFRLQMVGSNGQYVYFDNISVRLAEEDRSVNGKGLQVFGTITKTPVATGADLVAYSGFSTSNYLEQPYNSDLDFGTGDFCYQWWMKTSDKTGYPYIVSRCNSIGNDGIRAYIMPDGTMRFVLNGFVETTVDVATDTWVHICVSRTSGNLQIFINGKYNASGLVGDSVSTSNVFRAGLAFNGGNALDGSLALWRISATAPTAEQIKKIYEDEKVLFQENAKATLYGTSDAVTALAHDDSINLLHVGTSAGRSVFQGLRRVDNTTDAVGSCISAANGLVAED